MGKKAERKQKTDKKTSVKSVKEVKRIGIKKQYVKSRSACKITFTLPKEAAPEATQINIVGDFNNWDENATPLKRLRNGNFATTLELPSGREYRFRYWIDDSAWENDWWADRYAPNPYGTDDSVVIV